MTTNVPNNRPFTPNETLRQVAVAVSGVCAVAAAVLSVLLIANYLQVRAVTPLDNPELLKLRQQYIQTPQPDPQLAGQVRALDLLARRAYFTSQAQLRLGGYLLLGSAILALLGLRMSARFCAQPPVPGPEPSPTAYWAERVHAKKVVAAFASAWVVAALLVAFLSNSQPPTNTVVADAAPGTAAPGTAPADAKAQTPPPASTAPQPAPAPDWDAMQQNWPSFRGPGGLGVAHFTTAPTEWDIASGKNVAWKIEVPLPGANSPVVWKNRVFLSGATESAREVYCYDADSGKQLWKQSLGNLPGTPAEVPKSGEETGYAAPTMVVHGDRVCAIFVNGDLACYDVEGNLKWSKSFGLPDNHYGHSSSLLAFGSLLFVQLDQRGKPRLYALDLADGKEAWTVERKKISWASPVCAKTSAGFQLVLNSTKDVDAYNPETGAPIWTLACLDGEVAPSPAYGGGHFFVANEYASATCIRFKPDASPPQPEAAWTWDEALPDIASPVCSEKYCYLATSRGELVCLDAETGKAAWMHEYENGFNASPILVGDRVYALDKTGVMHVVKDAASFEEIATSKFDEAVLATPAFMDGRIYARTEKNLICIASGHGS